MSASSASTIGRSWREATRPPLTSVDMNLAALGREAGLTLLSLVGGQAGRAGHPKTAVPAGGASVMRPSTGRLRRTLPLGAAAPAISRPIEEENHEEASIAGLAFAAAFWRSASPHAAAETANIWVRADGSNFMPSIVDAFNKAHENQVKLDIIPNAEIIPKYGAAAAGGTAPDALSLDLIYTPAFAAAGQLEDITDWAKSLPVFRAAVAGACQDRHLQGPHLRPAVLGR